MNSRSIGSAGRRAVAIAAVSLIAACILVAASAAATRAWAGESVQIAGENRYETAARIAAEAYPGGTDGAILVTGESFADALSAASLAGLYDYPVLLTPSDRLDDCTYAALAMLGVNYVFLIGGEDAVSTACAAQVEAVVGAGKVERVAGDSRYSTALAVYERGMQDDAPGIWGSTALIASGADYPDAISASGYAFATKSPLFLSDPDEGLSADALRAVENGCFDDAVILGGTAAVSADAEHDLEQIEGLAVTRIGGANRYETSRDIAEFVQGELGYAEAACMATGRNYPDALTGCSLAGKNGGLMLLADSGRTAVVQALSSDTVQKLYYLGGEDALAPAVRRAAETALGWRSEHAIPLSVENERFVHSDYAQSARNKLTMTTDGGFSGLYYRMNLQITSATDPALYLSDFYGSFRLDGKIDDYTYLLSIGSIGYEVKPGTTATISLGDIESEVDATVASMLPSVMNVEYCYAEGLVGSTGEILPGGFILYLQGHDTGTLPETVVAYLTALGLMPSGEGDPLPVDVLYNVDSDVVFNGLTDQSL